MSMTANYARIALFGPGGKRRRTAETADSRFFDIVKEHLKDDHWRDALNDARLTLRLRAAAKEAGRF